MKLIKVKLTNLVNAPYNPLSRHTEDSKHIQLLAKSIEKYGLLEPPTVQHYKGAKYYLIGGHRRRIACGLAGFKEIMCRVIPKGVSPDEIYGVMDQCQRKHTGNDKLHVYLHNPLALSENDRKKIERIEGIIGRKLLTEMCSKGFSIGVYQEASALASYCNLQDDHAFLKKATAWVMKFGNTRVLRAHLVSGALCCTKFKQAISAGKPLKTSFTL